MGESIGLPPFGWKPNPATSRHVFFMNDTDAIKPDVKSETAFIPELHLD